MTSVKLIDVSLRDGNQSVWGATGVINEMVRKTAPLLDRAGYEAIELITSSTMSAAVRYQQEDPFERIDIAKRMLPNTKLGFLTTGRRFISFDQTPKCLMELAFTLLRRHGITRIWVVDPMLDMEASIENARLAKKVGFEEVVAGVCFTRSPVHTDEMYAQKIAQLDECQEIDSIYIKDPSGLLTPDRLRTLQPTLQAQLKRLKVDEIHTHCNTGLAPLNLLEAADLGMTKLHCALPPVANGSSHSNALQLFRNLQARGHEVNIDLGAMEVASECLKREAKLLGLPESIPFEYDEAYYRHTLAGGVLTTTRRQLSELGRPELMDKLTDEAVRVREDLGWPIVVTPFAQYIVTQATINLLTGERYSRLSNEIVDLLIGEFGALPGTVNQELLDRAMNTQHARSRLKHRGEEPSLKELRKQFDSSLSDEDFLLRALMPAEQVEKMVAARNRQGDKSLNALMDLLADEHAPYSVTLRDRRGSISFSGN